MVAIASVSIVGCSSAIVMQWSMAVRSKRDTVGATLSPQIASSETHR